MKKQQKDVQLDIQFTDIKQYFGLTKCSHIRKLNLNEENRMRDVDSVSCTNYVNLVSLDWGSHPLTSKTLLSLDREFNNGDEENEASSRKLLKDTK